MNDTPTIEASQTDISNPPKKSIPRHVLNRFETVPQEGWQLIKRWVGKRQASGNKLSIGNIERQAEMNTITPLIMAMFFTQDEHGKRRIPVFLTDITCKIVLADENEGYKRKLFGGTVLKIIIQYGSGPRCIVWPVYRTYWDFVKLHYRYRDSSGARLPPFPSLPKHYFLKKHVSPSKEKRFEPEGSVIEEEIYPSEASISSLMSSQMIEVVQPDRIVLGTLENYLNELIHSIEPCGYINRLCRFLELSSLGLQLAARNPGVHGKEGSAVLQSRTDKEPKKSRKTNVLACLTFQKARHRPKWCIVRESYLVCVDDPSELEIYDAFLFDQAFEVHRLNLFGDQSTHHSKSDQKKFRNAIANASHWAAGRAVVCVKNRQGVYHFRTKNEKHARQFELSLRNLAAKSIWCENHRFGSYAPVCHNTAVTWFVDGRDYFWDISVALENAKGTIYIHDWWLSPELYLRRPHTTQSEWRLDRVLRRKAQQGVKIYIVMYKEVAMALPLYSHLAKRRLQSLSDNIFVQRHPSRALDVFHKDSIFFWAHHEKICVIDNEIAYIGGIDKCFGRYDTPSHALIDDDSLIWPGKDYSNPRIIDFHTLDKPFEDSMDRSRLPRMPWHDISMRIVGSSARHVARHFVQRWNFLRRKKPAAPKRPIPMLLPVPDSKHRLSRRDPRLLHPHTSSACRVQILRSVSSWSIGFTDHVEHSILNAYIESIQTSQHFIYIENQFFVTSTKNGNTVIENGIGQAIVDRIIRAKKEGRRWRAIIVIPLVPGFPANVDETEATTVRLIMQCQYVSIGRGPDSILAKLHAAGVSHTHEYINFYGLRNWAEQNGQYVTEQVYIHAKTMVVDDLRVITGSANINERSQLGTRDSEIAACVDDTDLIESRLDGKAVRVGRYAHTLRMRLMCEHVGLDVDQMDRDKYSTTKPLASAYMKQPAWHTQRGDTSQLPPFVQCLSDEKRKALEADVSSSDISITLDECTKKTNSYPALSKPSSTKEGNLSPTKSVFHKRKSAKEDHLEFWTSLDCDTNANRDPGQALPDYYVCQPVLPLLMEGVNTVGSVYEILKDPLSDAFQDFWHVLARANTDLFRRSFLVMPDNNVKNWDQYHHFIKMAKVFLGRTDTKHGGTSAAAAAISVFQVNEGKVLDLLQHIRGHLVIWPNYFMEEADGANEFVFPLDKIAPIEIFD